ncbi:GNAT family N-acetyltransferase [Candidatus Woesearchaeota archaeon]|nr:GNAT family N-acetyltransferase [Candidatus Woesearchaeota archaeon]
MPIIKFKNFILRPYGKGDEKSLIENINDKKVSRYMCRIPYPYSMKDAKKWMKEFKKTNKNKTACSFAIEINGELVGGIGLMNIEKHKAEIGYWLGRKYWNVGIMTQAVKIATDFGFKKLKLRRIYATVFAKNKISAHILEKNGYQCEGLMRKYASKNGELYDVFLYAKTK